MKSVFKNSSRKKLTIAAVIVLFMALGIGFAYLSQALKISNTATVSTNSWNVHLENVVLEDGTVDGVFTPMIGIDGVSISASVTLKKPLDYLEYYVDVVNEGTLDAKLDSMTKTTLTADQQKYLEYTITYKDGSEMKQNDLLAAGERETLRIVIAMKDVSDASDFPTEAVTLELEGQVDYIQDDGTGVERSQNN